jgi:hypothetical protein
VRKIAALGFERAFFMHGDPTEQGTSARIGKLALARDAGRRGWALPGPSRLGERRGRFPTSCPCN